MIKYPDRLSLIFISIYIILLLYYSIQLLVYTDEFAINNLGTFNHSIAGLCEIIGIIFISLSIGLFLTIIFSPKLQMIIYITVLIMQIFITLNFKLIIHFNLIFHFLNLILNLNQFYNL